MSAFSISQDTNNNDGDLLSDNDVETPTNRTAINERDPSKTLNEESSTATLRGSSNQNINVNASTIELSDIVVHTCSNCQEPAQYLCMACGQSGPRYCSSKCQTEDWAKGHSKVCKAAYAGRPPTEEGQGEGSTAVRRSNSNKVYGRGNVAQIINARSSKFVTNPIQKYLFIYFLYLILFFFSQQFKEEIQLYLHLRQE